MTIPDLSADETLRACELLNRLYRPCNVLAGNGIHIPATFPSYELDWLEARRLAPNTILRQTHDSLIESLIATRNRWSIEAGATAFAASLDAEGPPHGALLEAVLLAHVMPKHSFQSRSSVCEICGLEQISTLDGSERFLLWHIWGTGIPGCVKWANLALEQLARWSQRAPTDRARSRLASIMRALDHLPLAARAGAAIEAVHGLGFFDESSRKEYSRGIVETLAIAGVLEAPPHVGLATRYVTYLERDARPTTRTEFDAPLGFWKGGNGVNWAHVRALFGLEHDAQLAPADGEVPDACIRLRPSKARMPSPPATLRRRPPLAGDVWGIRLREDAWILAYVWKVETQGARSWALIEYLDWFGVALPTRDAAANLALRGRKNCRWQMRAHSLEKTTGLVLFAEAVRTPLTGLAAPDRIPIGAAKELLHLAGWCFPELEQ